LVVEKGLIRGRGKIGRSDEHSIDRVYYVEGLNTTYSAYLYYVTKETIYSLDPLVLK